MVYPNLLLNTIIHSFNYPLFREEVGFDPAVYPSDIRQHGMN